MTDYRFAVNVNDDGDTERGEARVRALSSGLLADDVRFDADNGELVVATDLGLEFAHRRAREVVRAATDGTDLFAAPEPIGEWVPGDGT